MIRSGPSFSCSNRNVWHICCAKLFGLHSMLTSIPTYTTRAHPSIHPNQRLKRLFAVSVLSLSWQSHHAATYITHMLDKTIEMLHLHVR